MHNHLDGHEYFNKTMSLLNKLGIKRLANKTFLEVGFGLALPAIIFRGFGTRIYATEPYPVPWTPLRHGPFYDALLADARVADVNGTFNGSFDMEKASKFSRTCGNDPN